MYGFYDLLAILILGWVFYLLGFRIVRRHVAEEIETEVSLDTSRDEPTALQRRQILLSALNESPYTEVLSPRQRERLRYSLLNPGETWAEPEPAEDFEATILKPAQQTGQPSVPFVPPVGLAASVFELPKQTASESATVTPSSVTVPSKSLNPIPPLPPKPARAPLMDTIRANWDPAVMMLYLGALLVVVAGLIFATYNWGTLGGWQKLGMLAAVTVAFLVAGLAIRKIERVKPASTTFFIIGGLLVPANFLAAYTVFDDVQPAMTLLFGAIATTVIHALLSYQPGAGIFRYSAVGAALIAVATIPAALGFAAGWGGILGLIVIAMLPDDLFGLKRFQQAWVVISRSAAGPLAGFAFWQGWDSNGWIVAGTLVGVSMVATRLSYRYPELRQYLLAFADLSLIAASVQIAHNFNGDRWMVAAGLFALSLILFQESRRFPAHARWFEFTFAFVTAALAGEIVRVLGTDTWAIAVGFGALSFLILVHARRHENLAEISESVAAFSLPVSTAAMVYAIDPSLWSVVVGLATLTASVVWLGLRRTLPQNWPGAIATISLLGTIITLAPAIGLDWSWGCLAALVVIALAPYPYGRLESFAQPWTRIANTLFVPIGLTSLWRGAEINNWLVPLTLLAISAWLTRLALERFYDSRSLLVLADLFAIAGTVSIAWILRDDQWLVATTFLAIAFALVKRSFTWLELASVLRFAAGFAFAGFVSEVTSELTDPDRALAVGAIALTASMLVHARLHARHAWISEGVAAWSLPFAVAAGIWAYNESWWMLPISAATLTLTLTLHRVHHRIPGDFNLAVASLSGISAVLLAAYLFDITDDSRQMILLLVILGVVLTAIANVILSQFSSVSGWLKNLLRLEALSIFFAAGVLVDFNDALVLAVAILAMFWNIWATRASFWSLPMAGAIWIAWFEVMIPHGASADAYMLWGLALAAVYTALAWQLDRKTENPEEKLSAGVYLWPVVILMSAVLVLSTFFQMIDGESGLQEGIVLIVAAVLHWVGYRSTGSSVFLIPGGLLILAANYAWIFGNVSSVQHTVLSIIVLAIAGALYWRTNTVRLWLAFSCIVLGLVYIQLATDLTYTRDLLLTLVFVWVLVSLAITLWRSLETVRYSSSIFRQAMVFHALALVLPYLDRTSKEISRPDLVLMLVSLSGVVATFGSLRRSRELVLLGSVFGMSALMLQINVGAPGNLHAYTVPLSIYLLAVGLLLRRDPRIANTILTIGSAILIIPAMVEALTTGDIVWLWMALAEAIGLFLFGTMLRLRIPTAVGVIAVSVIALRMLVFAVSVLASWVSILAVGVALLLIGTMWLIFREAIQIRAKAIFGRWQSFD